MNRRGFLLLFARAPAVAVAAPLAALAAAAAPRNSIRSAGMTTDFDTRMITITNRCSDVEAHIERTVVESLRGNRTARILSECSTRASVDSALASRVTRLNCYVGALSATICDA